MKLTFLVYVFLYSANVFSQNGKTFFLKECASCHSVNKKIVAPALSDFEKRGGWKDREHLYAWLQDPSSISDPYIERLQAQYSGKKHPSFPDLSNKDIDAIIEYINKVASTLSSASFEKDTFHFTNQRSEEVSSIKKKWLKSERRHEETMDIGNAKFNFVYDSLMTVGIPSNAFFIVTVSEEILEKETNAMRNNQHNTIHDSLEFVPKNVGVELKADTSVFRITPVSSLQDSTPDFFSANGYQTWEWEIIPKREMPNAIINLTITYNSASNPHFGKRIRSYNIKVVAQKMTFIKSLTSFFDSLMGKLVAWSVIILPLTAFLYNTYKKRTVDKPNNK